MSASNDAFGLVTASLNSRYGDGDAELFKQSIDEAVAGDSPEATIRELANLASTLVSVLAQEGDVDPLELWSGCATSIASAATDHRATTLTFISVSCFSVNRKAYTGRY